MCGYGTEALGLLFLYICPSLVGRSVGRSVSVSFGVARRALLLNQIFDTCAVLPLPLVGAGNVKSSPP